MDERHNIVPLNVHLFCPAVGI